MLINNTIVASAQEERFTRVKHDNRFPYQALEWCLQSNNLSYNELDGIAFYEKPILKFDRVLHQHLQHFPRSYSPFTQYTSSWINQKLNIRHILKTELNYHGPVWFVPHHMAHAASSYYLSNYDNALIATLDGVGEWSTTTLNLGKNDSITQLSEIHFPHSLGLLYSTITAYLGFNVNADEYKVMGLAAYGNPKYYRSHFKKLLKQHQDGSFHLDMRFFDFDWANHMPSDLLIKLFGKPIRKANQPITYFHAAVAASLQERLETVFVNLLTTTHQTLTQKGFSTSNLCLAGGVALNSLMNGKLLSKTPFTNLFIPPDPGDGGGAMGASLFVAQQKSRATNTTFNHKKISNSFTPYLGPQSDWYQIQQALLKSKLPFETYSWQEIYSLVAQKLADGEVIAWFQGKLEWGPRALGNRSILASAHQKKMKDKINQKIKKRELFRPFAPVILEKNIATYFQSDTPLPKASKYMVLVYQFKNVAKKEVPACVHIDGTGRLQAVNKTDNKHYAKVLEAYEKLTGIKAIINTSLNIQEPIVATPEDVIATFKKSEIDILIIDQFVVRRQP